MPGTLPLQQTSDELLASSSDSLSSNNAAIGSTSQQHQGHDGISFDHTISADTTGSSTVRMGKMLETQPRAQPAAHHHAATGR